MKKTLELQTKQLELANEKEKHKFEKEIAAK